MQILAATDFSTRSNRALRRAGLLAQHANAQLHLVHVVDGDQPDELVRIETQEAKRLFGEQLDSMLGVRGARSHTSVVTGDPFERILKAAAEVKVDLIVMGSHRKRLLSDIFVGTTIERVIRQGAFPVLMVSLEAQRPYGNIIVPTDMSEASANALKVAMALGLIRDRGATLLHAFMPTTVSVEEFVATERQNASDQLARFVIETGIGRQRWSLRVQEGEAMEVISSAVEQMHPDLLIMGTHGRSGLARALLGSVTEEALRSLSADILAVPPHQGP